MNKIELPNKVPVLAAILLLLLIFGLPSLFYPFGRDQGIHAQVGAAWLDGQLPYRDVWHTKGFLSFMPHAFVTAVFGHQMWGIRLLDLIWQFGSGIFIFKIGRERMSHRGALLAVGLYYLVYYVFGYWHVAQPEGFLTLFVLLAIWLYERAAVTRRPEFSLFSAGFLMSLTPWFKQTAVVFLLALLLWAAYDYGANRGAIKKLWQILGGVLFANALVFGFLAGSGMLNPMLDSFHYAFFDYTEYDQAGLAEIARLTVSWGLWFPALIFPFLAGLGFVYNNKSLLPTWFGIVLMAFAGLASVYIQRHLWLYHLVVALPFMALIGAFSLENSLAFLQSIPQKKKNGLTWLFGFACLSLALPLLNRHLAYSTSIASFLSGATTKEEFLEGYELLDVVETAEYLKAHTNKDESIFIWGHYAMIYYLVDRPNPTRFINDPPLSLAHRRREEWRDEAADDLSAAPPVYIVVATDDTTGFERQTSKEQLPSFTALADFLVSDYRLETTIGDFELYRYR